MKLYAAREGAHLRDEDAALIGEYLDNAFGDLAIRPQDFVLSARPEKSPLHGYLEWDDALAGEQWRLDQARKILGSIEVVHDDDRRTRAYHNVTVTTETGQERAYVPHRVVWQSVDLRGQVIRAAADAAERAATRLEQYEDLAGDAAGLRSVAGSLRDKLAA